MDKVCRQPGRSSPAGDGAPSIMEVCGTHTHEIFRLGISESCQKQVELISGRMSCFVTLGGLLLTRPLCWQRNTA